MGPPQCSNYVQAQSLHWLWKINYVLSKLFKCIILSRNVSTSIIMIYLWRKSIFIYLVLFDINCLLSFHVFAKVKGTLRLLKTIVRTFLVGLFVDHLYLKFIKKLKSILNTHFRNRKNMLNESTRRTWILFYGQNLNKLAYMIRCPFCRNFIKPWIFIKNIYFLT